jgi:hypothetical protein
MGGILGIGFIILFLIAGFGLQADSPTYDDTIQEIRAYWEDDGQTYLVGDYLIGLAVMLFFLPFLVALRTVLGRAEGGAEMWSRVGFFGGVLMIAISAAATASWTGLAFAADKLSDDAVLTLMYLDVGAWHAFPYAVGVLTLFSSIVMAQTGVPWRWLGWLGIVIGIVAFISPLGILDDDPEDIFDVIGFIPFIGIAVWVVATSIGLVMMKAEPQPSTRGT